MVDDVPRFVDDLLGELLEELSAVMVLGPRACGKTTSAVRRARTVVRLDDPDQAAPSLSLSAEDSPRRSSSEPGRATPGCAGTSTSWCTGMLGRSPTSARPIGSARSCTPSRCRPRVSRTRRPVRGRQVSTSGRFGDTWTCSRTSESSSGCPPGTRTGSRLVKVPKYYVVDPGLAASVIGVDARAILASGDLLGRFVDTFVVAQLRPLLALGDPVASMSHLRDRGGEHEVDIVLETRSGEIIAIEVKAAGRAEAKDAKHLVWLREQVGSDFRCGVVFHTGPAAYPIDDRIVALPISWLWSDR